MTERFTDAEMRTAALAGKVLPLVQAHPDAAFPASIARILNSGNAPIGFENEVGASLRYLEKNGLLVSKKVKPPTGRGVQVRMYAVNPRGAFVLALTASR